MLFEQDPMSPAPRRGPHGLWQALVAEVVPPIEEPVEPWFRVAPAEIRAIAFAAALGRNDRRQRRVRVAEPVDLAGEEALLDYLARLDTRSSAA